jgi:uncharacterized protein
VQNLLDPAILFFAFGVLAGMLKSNLEVPPPIAKFLSLYLLMALGLKGGFALAQSGVDASAARAIGAAVALAFIVPALGFVLLRRVVSGFDAAAVAAAYGSVSAVTFVTAMQYLEAQQIAVGGHMTVAMVLMESPAIIMAVLLASSLRPASVGASAVHSGRGASLALAGGPSSMPGLGRVLHESFTDGAHLLLLGSMAVGYLSGEAGKAVMQPFSGDLFKGMLAFFLLDMGLMVARNFAAARSQAPLLVAYGVLAPLLHASLALALAALLGLEVGDATLLMVLAASASYIVVPAVLRHAVPEANPSLYFGLSLGLTFPLNILVGIPLYTLAARHVLGGA